MGRERYVLAYLLFHALFLPKTFMSLFPFMFPINLVSTFSPLKPYWYLFMPLMAFITF